MAKTISYDKLWKLLIDKKWNRTDLKEKSGISTASLAKLGKGENLTTAVLLKICTALDCNISDIMDVVEDDSPRKWDSGRNRITMGTIIPAQKFSKDNVSGLLKPIIYCCPFEGITDTAVSINLLLAEKLSGCRSSRRTMRIETFLIKY